MVMTEPFDVIIAQLGVRLHRLTWLVGVSLAWQTLLLVAAVGLLLTYRRR